MNMVCSMYFFSDFWYFGTYLLIWEVQIQKNILKASKCFQTVPLISLWKTSSANMIFDLYSGVPTRITFILVIDYILIISWKLCSLLVMIFKSKIEFSSISLTVSFLNYKDYCWYRLVLISLPTWKILCAAKGDIQFISHSHFSTIFVYSFFIWMVIYVDTIQEKVLKLANQECKEIALEKKKKMKRTFHRKLKKMR